MTSYKIGDRVRYTGRYDSTLANREARGELGTVTSVGHTIGVKWDCGEARRARLTLGKGVYPGNIELANVKIDTTKPLIIDNSYGTHSATFITMTSEGHILVDVPLESTLSPSWVIFETTGKFVRSSNNRGSALVLSNVPIEVVRYQRISPMNGLIEAAAWEDERFARFANNHQIVKVTSKDGRVTAVELLS